ncbi:hypothetical protein L3073_16835 [Ancylomarina sp. DW003]|nr:hypothetical protein [Ancylomarina sp. DW003]MDE5423881.1 hypothetical protein [Ancylomarina sp. DW003]
MLTIAVTANVSFFKPKLIVAPNDALHISLDSADCIIVMDNNMNLNELRGAVSKYLKSDTKIKSLALKCSRYSSYAMYLKMQDEISFTVMEYKRGIAFSKYGIKYEKLDNDKRELVDKECSVKIIESEPQ